jgi:hypothetical protein
MKAILTILLILSTLLISAQTEVPLALRMDMVTQLKYTEKGYLQNGVGTLEIKVFPYTVQKVESSGQLYIEFTNSRLTKSRKYLGWAFGTHEYQGSTVFFNKDTTLAWIWTVDRYGQIFKMDLPDYFARDARILKDSIQ